MNMSNIPGANMNDKSPDMRENKQTNSKKSTFFRLVKYIAPQKLTITAAFVFAALYVAATLILPVLIGKAIDLAVGVGNVDFKNILTLVFIIIGISLAGTLFQWLMTVLTGKISYKTAHSLRRDCSDKLSKVPLSYIDTNAHGDLISRVVSDVDAVCDGMLGGISQLFTAVITIVGTMVIMIRINYIVGIVVIALTPLSVVAASVIAKLIHGSFAKQGRIRGKLGAYAEEHITNQKLITAFVRESEAVNGFKKIDAELYTVGEKAQFYSSLVNPVTRCINALVYAAAGISGALLFIYTGTVTVGQISSFLSYANQYTKPFNEISGVIAQLQNALASAARVFAVLDANDEIDDGTETVSESKPELIFDDVSFSYVKDKPLLTNISLKIPYGSRVAIVGPTGCGKTTLINLLMRFYDVNEGKITLGGVDIRDMPRDTLHSKFGMVLQDTWLFSGTIRDNITYSKPNATDDEIREALKNSYLDGFIRRLPDGLDTQIGDGGGEISHGQRQLICIARVMLAKPDMLILDEATSNIDTMTEARISAAFEKMMKGRTSFIVAHRLSTIKNCDMILVMRDGNIIETGTHESLIEKQGFYYSMWNKK